MGLIDRIRDLFKIGEETSPDDGGASRNTSVITVKSIDSDTKSTNENTTKGTLPQSKTGSDLTVSDTRPVSRQIPPATPVRTAPYEGEKTTVLPSAAPKAPQLKQSEKKPAAKFHEPADGNASKPKSKAPAPQKKAEEKPKPPIKRPPDDYYPERRTFSSITMSADEYDEVSYIERVKPAEVSVTKGNGSIKLAAGATSIGSVSSYAHSELSQLLEAGYSARVTRIRVGETHELTYRRFDKDIGMSWEEYETTYDVHVTLELTKPQKLVGEAIVVSDVSSTKGNAKKRSQVRSVVAEKCRSRKLQPNEAIAVELTALGCTKPEIALAMGWTSGDANEYLRSAYTKLNIRSKAELEKLIKALSGEGNEEEVFNFSIAGTWYHQREAKGLLMAKAADLRAVREPYNTHDRNAVRIELSGGLVGYVPKYLSRDVAKLIDAGFEPSFTNLSASTHNDTEYYWDEWDIRHERETKRKIVDARVTLVCKNPYVKKKTEPQTNEASKKEAGKPAAKELCKAEITDGVVKLRKKYSLNQNEATVIERIAIGLSRSSISKELGWTINKVKDNAKSAYRKLGVHSKEEIRDLIEGEVARQARNAKANGQGRKQKAMTSQGESKQEPGINYVGIGDFIVRAHRYSTSHKGHTMDPVEAKVNVLVAGKYLSEKEFRAFYCRQCKKYFVTDTTYERLRRSGTLCCRVVEFDDVVNPKKGKGFASDFAVESTIHQFGYNVNKDEDLSSGERQAILTFIIENKIMKTYEIVSFLEGLISLRSSNSRMANAISKWKADVNFLEHYHPPKQSLKVDTMYAKKR